jgi:hypothetical protein
MPIRWNSEQRERRENSPVERGVEFDPDGTIWHFLALFGTKCRRLRARAGKKQAGGRRLAGCRRRGKRTGQRAVMGAASWDS